MLTLLLTTALADDGPLSEASDCIVDVQQSDRDHPLDWVVDECPVDTKKVLMQVPEDLCVAYYDEELQAWECVDDFVPFEMHELERATNNVPRYVVKSEGLIYD